jgi:hypothetical protein
MHQIRQILDAIDLDLDLIILIGRRCEVQAARAGDGYDRIGIVTFTVGVEQRLFKAGRVLLRMGGRDLLYQVVDRIVEINAGDLQRRRILCRIWNLKDEVKSARASLI